MVRKFAAVGAFFSCSMFASAEQFAPNLKDIRATDICGSPLVTAGVKVSDPALEAKISEALRRQDALFGTKFFGDKSGCNTFLSVTVTLMEVRNESGSMVGYAFHTQLAIQPFSVSEIVLLDGRHLSSAAPVVYNIDTISTTGSAKSQMEASVINSVEKRFQDFVLDWRKTH